MKTLKKFSLALGTILLSTTFAIQADAAVSDSVIQRAKRSITEQFSDLKDSDKVIPLEDGYLHGKAYKVPSNTLRISANTPYDYDSETDSRSITVEEAKKDSLDKFIKESEMDSIKPFAAYPPPIRQDGPALSAGSSYHSKAFSGRGWRYSEKWFINVCKAGGYTYFQGPLSYQSHMDGGRVGDWGDVHSMTVLDQISGVAIEANAPFKNVYPSSGQPWLLYYTYNPIPGTTYTVVGTGLPG